MINWGNFSFSFLDLFLKDLPFMQKVISTPKFILQTLQIMLKSLKELALNGSGVSAEGKHGLFVLLQLLSEEVLEFKIRKQRIILGCIWTFLVVFEFLPMERVDDWLVYMGSAFVSLNPSVSVLLVLPIDAKVAYICSLRSEMIDWIPEFDEYNRSFEV